MKKIGVSVLSILIGIIVFSALSAFFEAMSWYIGGLTSFMAIVTGILAGMKTYSHIIRKNGEQSEKLVNPKNVLFILLILQIPFAFGYANEFEDHIFSIIASVFFFMLEFWFLLRIKEKTGVTVLVSILLVVSVLALLAFIQEGPEIISDRYPEEIYYSTYWWVIAMLVGQVLIESVKLIVLYRSRIWRV